MKHLIYLLSAVLIFGSVNVSVAQKSGTKSSVSSKKSTPSKSKSKANVKKSTPSKSSSKNAKTSSMKADKSATSKSVKNDNELFEKKKKSWAIGAHVGYPFVQGDIPARFGIGYGLYIQKALGHTVSLRANVVNGYTTGLSWKRQAPESLGSNAALNGSKDYDSTVNYTQAPGGYFPNYRMDFTRFSLDAIITLNNLNFMTENPRLTAYVVAGAGVMLFDTRIDALNAKKEMYDYSDITNTSESQKQTVYNKLREKLDGTYESRADGNTNKNGSFADRNMVPCTSLGLGLGYKISNRVTLNLEGLYGYTGSDLLDGQQWYGRNVPTPNPDGFWYLNMGFSIRLGRTENVYWFTNPLAMPFKTIMESKKKLDKVDKIEKDLADLNGRVDSAFNDLAALKMDSDSDGVSDYFDLEDNTPAGSIVNGSGQTIFYKDDNGNLVYNDPNASGTSGTNPFGNNTGNNSGNNENMGNNYTGNNQGNLSMSKTSKKKTSFNKNDPTGKTVVMKGDGKGGLTAPSPGVMTTAGYMPAVFFESGSDHVSQSSYPDLFEVAKTLKANPNIKLHVIGNTDYRSTETFNQKLGLRRAQQVADVLVKYFGVNRDQLVVESRGELEPLTNSKNMDALAANRRVQFEVEGAPGSGNKTDAGTQTTPTKSKSKSKINDPNTPTPDQFGNDMNKKIKDSENKQNNQNDQQKKDTDF